MVSVATYYKYTVQYWNTVVPHQHNKRYSCSQGAGGMLARITSALSL
jgi:hypothetical protein